MDVDYEFRINFEAFSYFAWDLQGWAGEARRAP